jgi:hypothetical protein
VGRSLVVAVLLLAATIGSAAGPTRPPSSQFTAHVDNPWFPLEPGTRYAYVGVKDGEPSRDVVTVTRDVKKIQGVPCAVVRDLLYIRGRLEERTTDWYSQDARGNVWYFGEDTAELDRRGHVTSKEGSWQAGVQGAKPGIFMPAHPQVGDSGRQEYYKGHAEDHFAVIAVLPAVIGPRAQTTLLTREWTPLEPGVVDHKLYARGIGLVLEQTVKGGNERNELVGVTHIR